MWLPPIRITGSRAVVRSPAGVRERGRHVAQLAASVTAPAIVQREHPDAERREARRIYVRRHPRTRHSPRGIRGALASVDRVAPWVSSPWLSTFWFSDIEGSTKLVAEVGDRAFRELLREHRGIVRAAFAEYGGEEVGTEGDSFFATFPSPAAAASAAQVVCSELDGGPIQVRIGIHAGTLAARRGRSRRSRRAPRGPDRRRRARRAGRVVGRGEGAFRGRRRRSRRAPS